MSRERFIDFLKVVGLMVIFNITYLIRFNDSFGEYLIYNLSFDDSLKTSYTWFTVGMALFFFSVGFTNKIAWYSNVGRDGSQWKFLTDRVNALLGPAIVRILLLPYRSIYIQEQQMYPCILQAKMMGLFH